MCSGMSVSLYGRGWLYEWRCKVEKLIILIASILLWFYFIVIIKKLKESSETLENLMNRTAVLHFDQNKIKSSMTVAILFIAHRAMKSRYQIQ